MATIGKKFGLAWQQTMLRIKDPKLTVPFYERLGFKVLKTYEFPQWKFSLYFMFHPEPGATFPSDPASQEAADYLWNMKGVTLELTHNHGTETQPDFKYNNGNVEPNRGFGHVAVLTDDVYEASSALESEGVKFQKKPDEGRMKGLAFALDPDGYWVEIVKRTTPNPSYGRFNLAQTMLRIKDPKKSVPFYSDILGMTLVREAHFNDAKFSLYFFAQLPAGTEHPDPRSEAASDFVNSLFHPVIELTHNHGTEDDPAFAYHNGNTEPRGYGHIGFLVDDLNECCREMIEAGVKFQKTPDQGSMRGIAFALDPDNYWVELIQRGVKF